MHKPPVEGLVSDSRHIPVPKPMNNPEIFESESGLNDAGINNVDIDKEMAELAENHLFFNVGSHLANRQFAGLRKSITGRTS